MNVIGEADELVRQEWTEEALCSRWGWAMIPTLKNGNSHLDRG